MKKTILPLLIVLLFFSSTTLAQLPIKLGVRGGLNIANLSFDPDITASIPGSSKSSRTVFLVGGIFQLGFAGPFALEIEPTYIQKGAKVEGNNLVVNIGGLNYQVDKLTLTEKLSYLEIPILFRVYLPVPGIKPYAEAGPAIGFNMSSTLTTDVSVGGQSNSEDTDEKDNTSSVEFGLALGAGIEYSIAPFTSLVLDLRYSLGLTNTASNQSTQPGEQSQTVKTNGFQISAGLMFGL